MAKKTIDKNLSKEKILFLNKVKQAFSDPVKYFGIYESFDQNSGKLERRCDEQKFQEFFKNIQKLWLDPEVEGIVDKMPEIELRKKLFSNDVGEPSGRFVHRKKSIELNLDKFLNDNPVGDKKTEGSNRKDFSNKLASYIKVLCHEYQHFIQYEYVDAVNSGDEEKIRRIKPLLGDLSDEIVKSFNRAGYEIYSNDIIHFLKDVKPESYEKIKNELPPLMKFIQSKKSLFKRLNNKMINQHLVNDGFDMVDYYGRAHEIDARETSLRQLKNIKKDFKKVGSFDVSFNMDKHYIDNKVRNFAQMQMASRGYMDKVKEEASKISVDDFVRYSEGIDYLSEQEGFKKEFLFDRMKGSVEFGAYLNSLDQKVLTYSNVLDFILDGKTKDEKVSLLQEIVEKSSGGSFSQIYAKQKMKDVEQEQDLKSYDEKETGEPSVVKISEEEILKARSEESSNINQTDVVDKKEDAFSVDQLSDKKSFRNNLVVLESGQKKKVSEDKLNRIKQQDEKLEQQ